MIKISKNLKKFRKLSNLTQEQLAERMNLTRQAISNWENDKSQPDIDSIARLAEIFGITVEEMIYGSLKKVGVDENDENKRNVMKVVLSVFGGLFVAAGAIIIFVSFWEDFPDFIKSAFAFLPFVIGLAFAAFVYIKKRQSYVWREVAGVVWCVGVITSLSLFGDTLYDMISYENWETAGLILELVSLVLCIPAMFILKSVAVLPIYFANLLFCAADSGVTVGTTDENVLAFFVLPLFAVGALFTHLMKKDNELRYRFCVWISVSAFAVTNIAMYLSVGSELTVQAMILIFAAYCLLSEKQTVYGLPFRIVGTLGLCVSVTVSVFMTSDAYTSLEFVSIGQVFAPVTTLIFLGLCIYYVFADFAFEVSDALRYPAAVAAVVVGIIAALIKRDYYADSFDWERFYDAREKLGLLILTAAALIGLSFILKGISRLKLFELNVGIITVFAAFVMLVSSMFDFNMITVGILLILFGASMFASNLLVSRHKKELKQSE